jgi:hypothetical protein
MNVTTQETLAATGLAQKRAVSLSAVAYWTTTVLVAFAMASGGLGELLRWPGNLEVATVLGYPVYFLTIIGVWKVLGAIAILVPGWPMLKEWAYAGIVFNMTGAAASHAFAGDYGEYGFHLIATISILVLAAASWALRPRNRRPASERAM